MRKGSVTVVDVSGGISTYDNSGGTMREGSVTAVDVSGGSSTYNSAFGVNFGSYLLRSVVEAT